MKTNIRNSFLSKNIIDDLFDGSFWFGKNHNQAKQIMYTTKDKEEVLEIKVESEPEVSFKNMGVYKNSSDKIDVSKVFLETKHNITQEKLISEKSHILNKPNGYISLYMKDINPDELFVNHNITMKYLTINGNKLIKEIRLDNQGRELDCYSEGENESLTIEKISNTQLLLTLLESNGNMEKLIVINGQIIA